MTKKLPLEYYQHDDVLFLSRNLIGKVLMTHIGGTATGGIIVETEAYRAPLDRASHAFGNKKTKRNKAMFSQGGVSYIFLCYGIHVLFNIVTNKTDVPHAILIRAIEPLIGVDEMLKRRKQKHLTRTLASGPGTLTKALGITMEHNHILLTGPEIWLEDQSINFADVEIATGPRIGVDYAGEDADHPWRFRVKDSLWTS
jgi:DNA-3-methyladenine glycosylase